MFRNTRTFSSWFELTGYEERINDLCLTALACEKLRSFLPKACWLYSHGSYQGGASCPMENRIRGYRALPCTTFPDACHRNHPYLN